MILQHVKIYIACDIIYYNLNMLSYRKIWYELNTFVFNYSYTEAFFLYWSRAHARTTMLRGNGTGAWTSTTAVWTRSLPRLMIFVPRTGIFDLQTERWGRGSVSGTYWVWMCWRFLTLPCALLTTALCVSVQKTNWTEPINLTIIYVERNQIYGRSGSGRAAESRREHQEPLQNQGIHIFIHKMSYTISYICFLYHILHHICLNWYSVLYHSLFNMIW